MADCLAWLTPEEARDQWRDANGIDDDLLQSYLNTAAQQVTVYGPATIAENITATGCVPEHYRVAQLMQTRNLWNAGRTDPSSFEIGTDAIAVRPYPLDWTVKQIIRPKSPVPKVG